MPTILGPWRASRAVLEMEGVGVLLDYYNDCGRWSLAFRGHRIGKLNSYNAWAVLHNEESSQPECQ